MKPIAELTVGHVGKTIHVTDSDIEITGILHNLKVNVEVAPYHAVRRSEVVTLMVRRSYEIVLLLSGHTVNLTLDARWEEV